MRPTTQAPRTELDPVHVEELFAIVDKNEKNTLTRFNVLVAKMGKKYGNVYLKDLLNAKNYTGNTALIEAMKAVEYNEIHHEESTETSYK